MMQPPTCLFSTRGGHCALNRRTHLACNRNEVADVCSERIANGYQVAVGINSIFTMQSSESAIPPTANKAEIGSPVSESELGVAGAVLGESASFAAATDLFPRAAGFLSNCPLLARKGPAHARSDVRRISVSASSRSRFSNLQ